MSDDISCCPCNLDHGQWGQGGWHFYRPTEEELVRRELWRLAQRDPDLKRLLGHGQQDSPQVCTAREGCERVVRAAAGRPWAFEPCPAYRGAVEADINRRKAWERSGGDTAAEDQRMV